MNIWQAAGLIQWSADYFLRVLDIAASWPVAVVVFALLFRQQLSLIFSLVAERIADVESIKIGQLLEATLKLEENTRQLPQNEPDTLVDTPARGHRDGSGRGSQRKTVNPVFKQSTDLLYSARGTLTSSPRAAVLEAFMAVDHYLVDRCEEILKASGTTLNDGDFRVNRRVTLARLAGFSGELVEAYVSLRSLRNTVVHERTPVQESIARRAIDSAERLLASAIAEASRIQANQNVAEN